MIDIYCHILPGVDDGAQSLEESLLMARRAEEDGIDTIVATPHTLNGIDINPIKEVISMVFFCHYNKIEYRRPIQGFKCCVTSKTHYKLLCFILEFLCKIYCIS